MEGTARGCSAGGPSSNSTTRVGTPQPATAIVVDLRGFTLELNQTCEEDGSRARFNFLPIHNARGFTEHRAVFGLSRSSATLGNPRFDRLVARLTDDAAENAEVRALLD